MHNGALPANRRGLRGQAALGSFRQTVTRWRRCVFFLLRDFCRGDDECGAMTLQYTKSASKISWAARFFRRLLCRKALICSPNLRLSCSDGEVNTEGIAGFLWERARPERKIHWGWACADSVRQTDEARLVYACNGGSKLICALEGRAWEDHAPEFACHRWGGEMSAFAKRSSPMLCGRRLFRAGENFAVSSIDRRGRL